MRDIDSLTYGDAQYDLTSDGQVDTNDLDVLVSDIIGTWYGDSNGDGEFNTGDFVSVFSTGKFETGISATRSEGDWNHDGVFNSGDFVTVFKAGGFEKGQRTVAVVPEPMSILAAIVGAFTKLRRPRKRSTPN